MLKRNPPNNIVRFISVLSCPLQYWCTLFCPFLSPSCCCKRQHYKNCMKSCRLNESLKKCLVLLLWVLSSTHFMNPIPVEATPVMHVGPRIVSVERITCKDSLRVKIYTQNSTHCEKTGGGEEKRLHVLRRQLRTRLLSVDCQSLPISMCLLLFRGILQRCMLPFLFYWLGMNKEHI